MQAMAFAWVEAGRFCVAVRFCPALRTDLHRVTEKQLNSKNVALLSARVAAETGRSLEGSFLGMRLPFSTLYQAPSRYVLM